LRHLSLLEIPSVDVLPVELATIVNLGINKTMYIERIEIEGGFLDGLQLNLEPGLNVIIGARGTGKSSLIELIRYCLNAESFTDRARLQASQHAQAVLGSGRVTVYLRHREDRITVSRSTSEEQPRSTGLFPPVTVLAQNEIEAVGTDIAGRLRLVDTFLSESDRVMEVQRILSDLSSRTAEIQGVLNEISSLDRLSSELATVPDMLEAAVEQQQSHHDELLAPNFVLRRNMALPIAMLLDLDDTILAYDAVAEPTWLRICAQYAPKIGASSAEDLFALIKESRQWFWSDPEQTLLQKSTIMGFNTVLRLQNLV
jgi:energy-coupling factor transporter ATP-binding protein EcfA2